MKKIIIALSLTITLSACAQSNLGSLLGGLAGKTESTEQSSQPQKGSSSLGDALGGLLGGLLSTDKVKPESMVGTWKYTSPAVCFKSDDLLAKAGGSAMAGTIEGKLAPYYKTCGLDNLELTVNPDMTFTMKSGRISASGTIDTDGQGEVYFNFKAFGKVNIGKMKAYINMSMGKNMSLMFDVTKLVQIVKVVGSVSGSSAIQGITSLLEGYDGICAGFKLAKQ